MQAVTADREMKVQVASLKGDAGTYGAICIDTTHNLKKEFLVALHCRGC